MKPPLSYPAPFVLWFIGTSMNTVKHPTQGQHQLTLDQLKHSPGPYKNALYEAISKEYVQNPTLREKLKEYKNV